MMQRAAHVQVRPNRDGQPRAYIAGTRVRVQDVSVMAEVEGKSPDQIVQALPHLTLAQVHAALSYYFNHRDAIAREMREDEEFVRQWRSSAGPGIVGPKVERTGRDWNE